MGTAESQFLRHEACPKCGSTDACAVYTTHRHCFAFGCGFRERLDDTAPQSTRSKSIASKDLIEFNPITSTKRGITPETFAFWRYGEGTVGGDRVHVANHYVDGKHVGQKIRTANKKFSVFGKMDSLYGRWLWARGGRRVVVTEGEIDALSVSQAQGNKWPVVSVPNGAAGAVKAFKESIDWLSSFEEVVILFDGDAPGQAAAVECAQLLGPGKAKIASLPLKDANEMLKEGRTEELIRAIWNAREYRPDGILGLDDLTEQVLADLPLGRPWPWETLTKATHGRRDNDVYFLGAGTGVGKTDVFTQCVQFDLEVLKLTVGILFLEQPPQESVRRIAGKAAKRRFHVQDGGWTQEELVAAEAKLRANSKLYLYDNFGATEWEVVKEKIEYMAVALGCKHIYLDHLTALVAAADDERKELEKITAELAMLAKRLAITVHVISHLSTPEGTPHEEGGRVMIRHFKGSRAIGYWAHYMFGLERDQQHEDPIIRSTTTFRVLKDRHTGQATGVTFWLRYDPETCQLYECDDPRAESAFKDESAPSGGDY